MEKGRLLQRAAGLIVISLLLSPGFIPLRAQTKSVNSQYQSWVSVNNTLKVSLHWAVIADFHNRRNHFLGDNSFYFARTGVQYIIDKNLSATLGYGHFWGYPTTKGWHTIAHENRIYQQLQYTSRWRKVVLTQRLRNEQRWQQKIANDQFTGQLRFTDRVRYLFSLNMSLFKNPAFPALVLADELCLQSGKEIVYNTFDQNRFFIGIKEQLSTDLSFDIGYMRVFQQKRSGYEFDRNHTFRLYFYYNPQLFKHSGK